MTLKPIMTIEPYTKNRQLRNNVENIAEAYCSIKRSHVPAIKPTVLPDLIFTSDGCTGWPDDSWLSCCVVHDMAYWCGGSEQDRIDADQDLQQCVLQKQAFIGNIMYSGVRIGGVPWLPTPWRWGYGWDNWPREYEKLDNFTSPKKIIDTQYIHQKVNQQLLFRH